MCTCFKLLKKVNKQCKECGIWLIDYGLKKFSSHFPFFSHLQCLLNPTWNSRKNVCTLLSCHQTGFGYIVRSTLHVYTIIINSLWAKVCQYFLQFPDSIDMLYYSTYIIRLTHMVLIWYPGEFLESFFPTYN